MKNQAVCCSKGFEKYDKSRDAEIPCLFCGRMNPVVNDSYSFCHNPMVK